jgi:hypothetical protein
MKEIDELFKLRELLEQGAISDDEYKVLKGTILDSSKLDDKTVESPKLKQSMQKQKPAAAKSKQVRAKIKPESVESGWTNLWVGIGVLAGLLLGLVFIFRYDTFIALVLPIGLALGIIFILKRFVTKNLVRNLSLFGINALLVLLITFPIGDPVSYESSGTSSGTDMYCTKHNRAYNTQNAWKGCPDCVDQEWDNTVEESRQRLVKKYE